MTLFVTRRFSVKTLKILFYCLMPNGVLLRAFYAYEKAENQAMQFF